jgi:hypothetical protein
VRRRETVPPVARVRHADALDPANLLATGGAVEDELGEFALQIALHLQQLEPEIFAWTTIGSEAPARESWEPGLLAHLDSGATNGPTEGITNLIKVVKRQGF